MTQHTPRPMVVREQQGEIQIWEDYMTGKVRNESCVAVMNGWPTDTGRSEARLLASSTMLLEALKYARRMVKESECDIAYIDAAIAAATGEQA